MNPEDTNFNNEQRQYFLRNFMAHTLDIGFYFAGLAFVSVDTILPPIIKALNGPIWLISLLPFFLYGGISLPSIFIARLTEATYWKKSIIKWTAFLQRLPFLITGLSLIFLARDYPLLVVYMTALTPLISGLSAGVGFPAWQELVAKTIPTRRRASVMAMGFFTGSLAGLFAGGVITAVLERYPDTTGYGILHLLAFVLMFLSYGALMMIRETNLPPNPENQDTPFLRSLAKFPAILKENRDFRNYCLSFVCMNGIYLVMPFLSIRAISVLEMPESHLGFLVIAFVAGGCAGNLYAGFLGDRLGNKFALATSRISALLMCLFAIIASNEWMFLATFFCGGFSRFCNSVSATTFVMELAPVKRRPTYLALANAHLFPSMLFVGLLSMTVWKITESFELLAGIAAVLMVFSLFFLIRVPDPRGQSSAEN